MSYSMRSILPVLATALALALPAAADAAVPATTPVPATNFVNSVGVNVHTGYYDTAYNNFAAVKSALLNLGVKYVRDGACASCLDQQSRLQQLGAAGLKADLIVGSASHYESLSSLMSMIDAKLAPMTASIEGPNEFDQTGILDWATKLRSWQQSLYPAVKSDPNLAGVPVYGPSLVQSTSYSAAGDLSGSLDCGNLHPYPGGALPTAVLFTDLTLEKLVAGNKPVCVTESGYHNATSTTDGHLPASEAAAGAYVPRMFLDYFQAGIPRTYDYELVDEHADTSNTQSEQHFGLLRNDFSPKPAYTSLQRLLQLVSTTSQAAPVATRVQATGPSDLRQMLLQQDAHHQVLVLWRNVSVWDRIARKDIAVTPAPVNVAFGQPVGASAYTIDGNTNQATQTATNPSHMTVNVGGQAVVVQLTLP